MIGTEKLYFPVYLTFGEADFTNIISFGSGPSLKFEGARGLVVKLPIKGADVTLESIVFNLY